MSRIAALGLTLICLHFLIRHLWALGISFIIDDFLLLDHARSLSLAGLFGYSDAIGNAWRPISRNIYFSSLQNLFGANPTPFHVVNLGVATTSIVLFFFLLRDVLGRQPRASNDGAAAASADSSLTQAEAPALLGTLIFAAHPSVGTPASWTCGIQDLLAVMFGIAAFLAHVRGRRALYVLLFAAAAMSKEMVVPLAGLLVLYDVFVDKEPVRVALRRQAATFALIILWLLTNRWLPWHDLGATIHTSTPGEMNVLGRMDFQTVWLTVQTLLLIEPREAFVWPYGVPTTAGIIVLGAAVVVIAAWRPWVESAHRALTPFGALWCLSGIVPVVVVYSRFVYYSYYPVLGLALVLIVAIVLLTARAPAPRAVRLAVGAVLVAYLTLGAGIRHDGSGKGPHNIRRASEHLWRYKADLERMHPTLPDSAMVYVWNIPVYVGFQVANGPALRVWYDNPTLESRFLREFEYQPGRPTFFFSHDFDDHLVEIFPGLPDPNLADPPAVYATAHADLAYHFSRANLYDFAILECQKALRVDPDHKVALANLGTFLVDVGRLEEAVPVLERAIPLHPGAAELRFYLGFSYAQLGDGERAARELGAYVRMAPSSPNVRLARQLLQKLRAQSGGSP